MTSQQIWGVEYWGPSLVSRWRTIISSDKKAMLAFEFNRLPASIGQVPVALSMISEPVEIEYSEGQANFAIWKGRTQFYLSLAQDMSRLSYINQFYRLIVEAAAYTLTLDGKVELFTISQVGPSLLNWGSETDYLGLVAPWEIRENVTGKFTVGV